MGTRRTRVTVLVAITLPLVFGSSTHAQFCKTTNTPDVVRIRLSPDCGDPARIELRRNGDDKVRVPAVRQHEGWWLAPPYRDPMKNVSYCSKVCGYASVCVAATALPEHDAAGQRICVAEYKFGCEEAAWTLAVEASPPATLMYKRKREQSREQSGEMKAVPAPLKRAQICDLAVSETIEIIPQTRPHYSFVPIPVWHEKLQGRRNQEWPLSRTTLIDYVRLPEGRRSRALSEGERAYFQLDIRELKLMIAREHKDHR